MGPNVEQGEPTVLPPQSNRNSPRNHTGIHHVLPSKPIRGILAALLTTQGSIVVANTQSGKPVLLFKHKEGTVTATIIGPTIGFLWTRIEYSRNMKSTKEPDQWEKRFPDREVDQIHLERCVKKVRAWLRERDRR